MDKKISCDILFENALKNKVYFGGQMLNGRVILTILREITLKGIFVKINGRAKCEWVQGGGDTKKKYSGREQYLSDKTYLIGSENDELKLLPGVYNYTFQCMLPPGIPTSFEGKYGYIRYSVVVCIDRSKVWSDQEYEEGFTVIKPLNLNDHIALRCPVEREEKRRFRLCCLLFCCNSHPLILTVRMPVSGYTPGQTIVIDMEANNNSNVHIRKFYIKLVKIIKYHSQQLTQKTKEEIITLVETKTNGCLIGLVETYRERLIVPPIPPTDKTSSNICKIRYAIRITGKVTCCHTDPEVSIPITIGTIPFSEDIHSTIYKNEEPSSATASTKEMPENLDEILVQKYSDIAPPKYEEAISDKATIQGKPFLPLYPVYRDASVL